MIYNIYICQNYDVITHISRDSWDQFDP